MKAAVVEYKQYILFCLLLLFFASWHVRHGAPLKPGRYNKNECMFTRDNKDETCRQEKQSF